MNPKIRVAVLLDGRGLPAWQSYIVEQLRASDYATVDLLLLVGDGSPEGHRKPFLYRAFAKRDARRPVAAPDACAKTDIENWMPGIERLRFPQGTAPTSRDGPAMEQIIGEIGTRELDLILAFSGLRRIDELASIAKQGVWFYRHGYRQMACEDGQTVGFWEVVKRRPFVYSSLNRRLPGSPDEVLYDSFSPVNHLSHFTTRNEHLWKIQSFVPRVLRRLHRGSSDSNDKRTNEEDAACIPLSSLRLLAGLTSYAFWRVRQKRARKIYSRRWILLFTRGAPEDWSGYRKLVPPKGRFWADPHVLRRDGGDYVFFEDASLEAWRGHLSVMCLSANASEPEVRKIIERPYHLSYPFLLEWKGETWIIPESGENRTVEAYRCREFPFRWEYSHCLMKDVSAYDATLFQHDGIWWMFANVREHEGASTWDELCLFYADDPLSESWRPHPMNPIVSDVRQARPGGPLFCRDGRIFRPSQNSSYRYGYGLNINEVLELSETGYRERVVERIEPNWDRNVQGIHSYSAIDGLAVVDAIYRSRKP